MAESVFVRKATGLVRDVGLVSGILFGVTFSVQIFSGACCVIPYYSGYENFSGNYWLSIVIALITALLVLSVYAHFSAAMPRSGGDYIFLGRTMHPLLGFAPSFTFYLINCIWQGMGPPFFYTYVVLLASSLLPAASAAPLSSQGGIYALAILFWLIGFIPLFGMKWITRMQSVTWIITFAAIGVTAYYMYAALGVFPSLFNKWSLQYVPTEPDMYHKVISDGLAAGFNPNPPPEGLFMPATLSLVVVLLGQSIPFQAGIIWIAGEVKKAESAVRQHIIVSIAALASFFVFVFTSLPWIVGVGNEFTGAFYSLGGNLNGLPTNFMVFSLFPAIMPPWASAFYALSAILCVFAVNWVCNVAVSRSLFAWSFDRLFPSFFAHVDDRFKTPTYAYLAVQATEAVIALIVFTAGSVFYTVVGALVFFVLINVIVACGAGMVFPFIRKDMYEQMPLKSQIAGIPALSVISFSGLALVLWSMTSYFTNAAFFAGSGITTLAVGFGAAMWVSAIIIFYVSRTYNKMRGIDLDLAFRQIPPA